MGLQGHILRTGCSFVADEDGVVVAYGSSWTAWRRLVPRLAVRLSVRARPRRRARAARRRVGRPGRAPAHDDRCDPAHLERPLRAAWARAGDTCADVHRPPAARRLRLRSRVWPTSRRSTRPRTASIATSITSTGRRTPRAPSGATAYSYSVGGRHRAGRRDDAGSGRRRPRGRACARRRRGSRAHPRLVARARRGRAGRAAAPRAGARAPPALGRTSSRRPPSRRPATRCIRRAACEARSTGIHHTCGFRTLSRCRAKRGSWSS